MKKLVVLGGGISGYGSAILARRKGFDVFLSDSGRIADRYRMKLEAWGVPYEEGGHSEERILAASECVKSPGIPDSAPIVRKLRERGVPVISEIEFAGRYLDGARTICITGSNGKTTTTSLVYRILRDAGCNVALGGNIGESFAYSVATGRYDWYVLELSSFQLDGMFRFRADIGVLTNITPDHLDRYDHSFAKYAAAKMRIAQNQRAGDYFIYSADDETIWSLLPSYRLPQRQLPFAARAAVAGSDGDAFLSRDGRFTAAVGDRSVEIDTRRMRIGGLHNAYNAMAAALAALAAGVLGTTGVESADMIRALAAHLNPDAIVAVDALACAELGRLGRTVQLTDTGITPGSGVGNNRAGLSRDTLGIPVAAIGLPTVIDAGGFSDDPRAEQMFVTPRDIDTVVRDAAKLIGYGINLALHDGLTIGDVDMFLS